MSSPNNIVGGLTFIQNLARVAEKSPFPITQSVVNLNWPQTAPLLTPYDSIIATLRATNMPTTPKEFVNFLTGNSVNITQAGMDIVNALYSDFKHMTNQGDDWTLLSPTDGVPMAFASMNTATTGFNNTGTLAGQFNNWFSNFLATYPFFNSDNGTGKDPTGSLDFLTTASRNLTTTAALQTTSTLPSLIGVARGEIPSYEEIYKAFFPNGNFSARLTQFYNDELKANGFFVPSQAFAAWTQAVIEDVNKSLGILTKSSLASGNFSETAILNRIFQLIADLLGSMQKVAAAQANRLLILTQWQQAYTNSLQQIHYFLQADGTPLGVSTSTDSNQKGPFLRGKLNDFNSTLRQNMQANSSVISDDSKALQSNLNQSNDAVSQQATAASQIIQELTTILQSIYR